jgi:hypothetical protein
MLQGDRTEAYPAGVIGGEAELADWEAGETGLGGVPPKWVSDTLVPDVPIPGIRGASPRAPASSGVRRAG